MSHTILIHIVYNNNIRDDNIKTALRIQLDTSPLSIYYYHTQRASCKCNIIIYNKNVGSVAHIIMSIMESYNPNRMFSHMLFEDDQLSLATHHI